MSGGEWESGGVEFNPFLTGFSFKPEIYFTGYLFHGLFISRAIYFTGNF
jgi:hypothetical protein